MAKSVIKKTIGNWKLIGNYELVKSEEVTINIKDYSEFLIQFGNSNSTQPYGGMTYTDVITNHHSNVSFLPVYINGNIYGCVYFYSYNGIVRLCNYSDENKILFYVYVR